MYSVCHVGLVDERSILGNIKRGVRDGCCNTSSGNLVLHVTHSCKSHSASFVTKTVLVSVQANRLTSKRVLRTISYAFQHCGYTSVMHFNITDIHQLCISTLRIYISYTFQHYGYTSVMHFNITALHQLCIST